MNKGIFFIPVNDQNKKNDVLFDEIISQTIEAEKWGIKEAFFGEHITDKHEKISSSLSMVSALSHLTKNIKLGTLTTNLNFFKPATISAIISQVDNLTKGRLMLGVGSGANRSDVEAVDMLEENNHKIMLEILGILKKIFYEKDGLKVKTDNFTVSTEKSFNEELGLGFFNKLYNNRKNLEIVMPALNKNSYNVKLCAKNQWSIVISNFCSEEIIDNHIKNYLEHSDLNEEEALKKIKLSKLIFVSEDKNNVETKLVAEDSPYLKVVDVIYKKLKTFDKHQCFGEGLSNSAEALKSICLFGNPDQIKEKVSQYKSKYGSLSSLIFVDVPKTNKEEYDKSLELFAKYV